MKRPVWLPHENEPHSISLWINLSSIIFQIKSIDVTQDPISKLGDITRQYKLQYINITNFGDMAMLSIDDKSSYIKYLIKKVKPL